MGLTADPFQEPVTQLVLQWGTTCVSRFFLFGGMHQACLSLSLSPSVGTCIFPGVPNPLTLTLPRWHPGLSLSCPAPLTSASVPPSCARMSHASPSHIPPFPHSHVPPLTCVSPFLRPRVPPFLSLSPFLHLCVRLSPFPRPALAFGMRLNGPLPAHPCLRGLQVDIFIYGI
jgi:hypothetical protein